MPFLRYFVGAGVGLLALLFIVSSWLPAPVADDRDASGFDRTTIRISGEKPAAERVTIDTSIPTVTPPAATVAAAEPAATQSESPDDARDALARMEDTPAVAPVVAPSQPVKKVTARKRPRRPVEVAKPAGLFALW